MSTNKYLNYRLAQHDLARKRRIQRLEAELKELQTAEAAEQERINREVPPCLRGEHCEWAKDTQSDKITCLRIGGCVKLDRKE